MEWKEGGSERKVGDVMRCTVLKRVEDVGVPSSLRGSFG